MTGNLGVPPDSGYAEPGGRAPAPAPLRLAQVFANTADRESGTDVLRTPDALVEWLASYRLLGRLEKAGADDLRLALDLREGMRALFLGHHGGQASLDADGLARLNAALRSLPVRLLVTDGVVNAAPAGDGAVCGALTEIAAVLVRARPDQLARLKACQRDVCQWVFYDSSRNRAGIWCAMDICGARTNMRTYRNRRSDSAGASEADGGS